MATSNYELSVAFNIYYYYKNWQRVSSEHIYKVRTKNKPFLKIYIKMVVVKKTLKNTDVDYGQ